MLCPLNITLIWNQDLGETLRQYNIQQMFDNMANVHDVLHVGHTVQSSN